MARFLVTFTTVCLMATFFFLYIKNEVLPQKTASSIVEIEQPFISGKDVNDNQGDFLTYSHSELGITFDYPAAWGEVSLKEVEKGHVQASFLGKLAEGSPTNFFAYKTVEYEPVGRGGYWGDYTLLDSGDICQNKLTNYNCGEIKIGTQTAVSFKEIPFGCDVEGAVVATNYLVPIMQEGYETGVVFTDQMIANASCVTRDPQVADEFERLIQSIRYSS